MLIIYLLSMTNINDTLGNTPYEKDAYEKDGRGDLTQKGWLDRERDRANRNTESIDWKKYVENWQEQLSGYAFPQVSIKNETDMQIFISEMITAIAKMFTKLRGQKIEQNYEVAQMAFGLAQKFMGELGY